MKFLLETWLENHKSTQSFLRKPFRKSKCKRIRKDIFNYIKHEMQGKKYGNVQ